MNEIRIRSLIWNDWNVAHIARHDVEPEEVEQVCHGNFIASQTYKGRIRITGPTFAERMLAIILKPEGDEKYYCVTAHDANKGETKRYHELRRRTS
ncbi:MAG: hypothetical protein NVS4B11_07490 [Ktedonobacteraceae bacterium]